MSGTEQGAEAGGDVLSGLLSGMVPLWLRRMIAAGEGEPPFRKALEGAGLFVDIAGFTKLTDTLARVGAAGGAERLSWLLDQYFGRLLQIVEEHRGDAACFVGDAVLCVWTGDPGSAVLRAARCALDIQRALPQVDFGDGLRLSQRISIGAGGFEAEILGLPERRMGLLRGAVLEQLGRGLKVVEPGGVRLSPEAAAHIREQGRGARDAHGLLLERVELEDITGGRAHPQELVLPVSALRPWLPQIMLRRLEAGLAMRHGEFRNVSSVFVSLSAVPPDQMQAVMCEVIAEVLQHGGHISQLIHDEKGTTLVLAFGVPLLSHEDDASRAVFCALRLREIVAAALHTEQAGEQAGASTGVTTGRVFCGAYGPERRRHYDCLGAAVNLAARLMEGARGRLLCDAATARSIRSGQGLQFESAGVLTVKGRAEPIPVFLPERAERRRRLRLDVVGRQRERGMIREAVETGRKLKVGVRVRIEGEAGIGKTLLMSDVAEMLQGLGWEVVMAAGVAVDQHTPLSVWRGIWRTLAVQDPRAADAPERQSPRYLLEGDRGADRQDSRRTLSEGDGTPMERLLSLLRRSKGAAPLCLLIDDAQHLDGSSLEMLRALGERLPGLGLVLANQPDARVEGWRGWVRVKLGGLSQWETEALIARCLGVSEIPLEVLNFIWTHAEGHPFFSEELAQALRDEGVVQIEEGECTLMRPEALAQVAFPASVEGLITARVDALGPATQHALQVASVLGRYFPLAGLVQLLDLAPELVGRIIGELLSANLLVLDGVVPEPVYKFRHAIVQDVAYNQLLFSVRRRFHQRAAEWIEQTGGAGGPGRQEAGPDPALDPALYAQLAHHWSRAEDSGRARHWLIRAGEQALQSWAMPEAVAQFSGALALSTTVEQQADLQLRLGGIARRAWDPARAIEHMRAAARLQRLEAPDWRVGLLRLGWHRAVGRQPEAPGAGGTLLGLGEAGFLAMDRRMLLDNACAALAADSSPTVQATGLALAAIGLGAGGMGAGWLARRLRLAAQEIQLQEPIEVARVRFYVAWQAIAEGEPAVALLEQAITLSLEDRLLAARARLALAWLALWRGQAGEALGRVESIWALPEDGRLPVEAMVAAVRAVASAGSDQPDLEALDQLEAALQRPLPPLEAILGAAAAAEVLGATGSFAPARRHAERCLHLLDAHRLPLWPMLRFLEGAQRGVGSGPLADQIGEEIRRLRRSVRATG